MAISPFLLAANVCQFCLCNHCLQKVVATSPPGGNARDKFRIRGIARNKFWNRRRLHVQTLKPWETQRQRGQRKRRSVGRVPIGM